MAVWSSDRTYSVDERWDGGATPDTTSRLSFINSWTIHPDLSTIFSNRTLIDSFCNGGQFGLAESALTNLLQQADYEGLNQSERIQLLDRLILTIRKTQPGLLGSARIQLSALRPLPRRPSAHQPNMGSLIQSSLGLTSPGIPNNSDW